MPQKKNKPKVKPKINLKAIEFYKLTLDKNFSKDVEKIKDWVFNHFIEEDEIIFEEAINDLLFQEEIDKILDKYNLSEDWFFALCELVLDGRKLIIDRNFNPDGLTIYSKPDDPHFVYLRMGKNTTLEEVKEKWPRIEQQIKKIPGYKKPKKEYRNFFRDYLIYNWRKRGMTYEEIAVKIDKEYPGKYEMSISNVKKIVSKFKKDYL
jgi:ribosomal protein L31E